MLLLLLVHLLVFHLLSSARDVPLRKDVGYIIEHIDTCPKEGFYFKKEPIQNSVEPELCFLCFCQDDNTAVCWRRDNNKCDAASFYFQRAKRDSRIRRSPGFADLFFRDAARDVFNKNGKTECKPFESSFSDDCPPADWCIGCTVCDCDANGRWDCHVLSFCPDKHKKSKHDKKGDARKIVHKKHVKPSPPSTKPAPLIKRQANNVKNHPTKTTKTKTKTTPPIKHEPHKTLQWRSNKHSQQKQIFKKSVPILPLEPDTLQKSKNTVRYQRIPTGKTNQPKEKIIKRNVATHSPIDINSSKYNIERELAQQVVKKIMANLRNSVNNMAKNLAGKGIKKKPNTQSNLKKRQIKKPQKRQPPKRPYRKPYRKPTKKPIKLANKKQTKFAKKSPPKKYNRQKRDLTVLGLTETLTTPVIPGNFKNSTEPVSLSPTTATLLNYTVKNDSSCDNGNCSNKVLKNETLPRDNYYKYTVGTEGTNVPLKNTISTTNADVQKVKEDKNKNVTETILNLIGTQMIPTIPTENADTTPYKELKTNKPFHDEANKTNLLPEINPEANDLKFSNWPTLKVSQEAILTSGLEKHKTVFKLITPVNKSINLDDYKNRVHGKNVEKTLWTKLQPKKHNIVKLLTLPKSSTIGIHNNITSTTHMPPNRVEFIPKIDDLQNMLSKLYIIKDNNKHNNTENNLTIIPKTSPKKRRKFSIVRYLKRIINKIFRRKKSPKQLMKHHIIETLCETFGPCKINAKDKIILKLKLAELDAETKKILRTVKIIKGLLKLIDLPPINSEDPAKEHIHDEIKKLNNILKDVYLNDGNLHLSMTQLTQIEYIKKNTKNFIQSVSKFAALLNEIINILVKHNKHPSKSCSRILRHTDINKNVTKENPFQDFRSLLERYNLIQNNFMKQMYEQLNNFESKLNEKPKVSEVKDMNNTVAIENFSRNIIQNLRKLKRLAQTLSYNGRSKRELTRDDDAIEYLLMLMEYLLRQNHPLDAAPVNDGIDLLIEAIKNAPDIKPIKKKVLEYTPATISEFSITTPVTVYVNTEHMIDDDSPSDSDKTSSEDHEKPKLDEAEDTVKQKIEEHKEIIDMVTEDDKEAEDKYAIERRVDKIDEITEVAFYKRVEDNVVLDSENGFETTTTPTVEPEIGERMIDREEPIEITKPKVVENSNIEKPAVEGGVDERKFEVFNADMDEEIIIPTVTFAISDVSSMTTEGAAQSKKSKAKMRHLNLESFDSESIDKKSKLEWIEENFGRESEKEKELIETDADESNTTVAVTVTPKTIQAKSTEKADVSVLSHEMSENDKKVKAKLNAEDVMFRKQMDLLNSLDYGTEKTEVEESDSKDGNAEDRYSSDTFPSYFV